MDEIAPLPLRMPEGGRFGVEDSRRALSGALRIAGEGAAQLALPADGPSPLRLSPAGEAGPRPEALGQPPSVPGESPDVLSALGRSFLDLVIEANERGHSANRKMHAVAAGQSDDIHGTMIELSKSGIQTRLMVNAKNQIVDAFYEIWRMSV